MSFSTPHADPTTWPYPAPVGCRLSGSPLGTPVTIEYGRIFSHNGVVLSPDNHILTDLSPDILPPPSGHRIADYPALPEPTDLDADVLTLVCAGSWKNYFHWLVDALPRLRHIDPTSYDLVYTPLTGPFHHEALDALGIPESKRLEARIDCHYRCRSLTAISPLPLSKLSRPDADYIRRLFPTKPSTSKRRIYLSRGDSWRRRLLNEDALLEFLQEHNIETHTLAGLSIAGQAQLFSEAELVIASHGAALTNLLFAPPSCRVFELFASNYIYPHYQDLSKTRGLDYYSHTSPNPAKNPDSHAHLETLLPALKAFLSTLT